MRRKVITFILFFLIGISYAGIRVQLFQNSPTTITNDTDTYLAIANLKFTDPQFWAGIRPFTYPLLLKIFNFNLDLIVLFQIIYSIGSWLVLAFLVSKKVSVFPVKVFSFFFILLFSLSTDVILWDRLTQTESINLSIFINLVSIYLANSFNLSLKQFFFVFPIWILWAFLRDTNAWLLLFIGLISVGYLSLIRSRFNNHILPLFLIFIFFLSNYSANAGQRWVVPLQNVISVRILPDKEYLYEFGLRGMPINDILLKQEGRAFSQAYFTDENLQQFREWLHQYGKNSYMKFLLAHPDYFLQAPFENWGFVFGYLPASQGTLNDNLDYAPKGFKEFFPNSLAEFIYPKRFGLLILLISFIITGILSGQLQHLKSQPEDLLILLLLLSAYPMLIINYHGDASGIARHALGAVFQIILACWIFFLIYADRLVLWFVSISRKRQLFP